MYPKYVKFRGALYQEQPTVKELLNLSILLIDQAISRAQAADAVALQYHLDLGPLEPAIGSLTTAKRLLTRASRNLHRRLAEVPEEAWASYADQYDEFAKQVDQLEALLDHLIKQTQGTMAVPLIWEARNLVRDIDRDLGW